MLKLSASSDLGRNVLLPWQNDFQDLHPQVASRPQLSDLMANVYSDPVDAAFRYGEPLDSSLVALPLAMSNRQVLCASAAYLIRHGAPASPDELAQHDCLYFMRGVKTFVIGGASRVRVTANSRCALGA
ncbi:hypothetical protein ALDI51_15580 [Alicycliphilus denitrificans]|uniref:LysR substrate-binding domain-containing protein n=1 Tax=Alicycliphilus denitrificans TaxID=179636 RepID=UPI002ECFDC49|nr:hypothetical protein ALDI51_15580 [Alicycliphilus denitrificans]